MDVSKTVLLDSNIVIYTGVPQYGNLRNWLKSKEIAISDISRLEVLGYQKLVPKDRYYFEGFFKQCKLFAITDHIIDLAIVFRSQKTMSVGDSIIAATAKEHQLSLITANTKDFTHLENIEVINPLTL